MVSAAMFRQKTRNEGRNAGREAGREEAHTAWREWNRRREEAIAQGKPFDEPTPNATDGTEPPSPYRYGEPRR